MKLRPYQEQAINDIRNAFRKHHSVLYVLPTGGGKTLTFAVIAKGARARKNRTIILVHRREILEQTLSKLWAMGITAGQIASGVPQTSELVQVAMVHTLRNRLGKTPRPDLIISDECFPSGTLIDGTPIEEVSPGDHVRALNHSSGKVQKRPVCRVFSREYSGTWYRLHFEDGTELTCTEGHPIYVADIGYLPAAALAGLAGFVEGVRDEMCELRQGAIQRAHKRRQDPEASEVLQSCVLHRTSRATSEAKNSEAASVQSVRRSGRLRKHEHIQPCEEARVRLPQGVSAQAPLRDQFSANAPHQSTSIRSSQRANETEEPNEQSRNETKDGQVDEGENVSLTWRQWPTNSAADSDRGSNGTSHGIRHPDGGGQRPVREPSAMLQGRSCRSGRVAGDRSGSENASVEEVALSRCSENHRPERVRLVRVEVYERGSRRRPSWVPRSDRVYNLHVEKDENYFANGILVHNCHHVLSDNTWGRILQYWREVPRLGVTATPARLDGRGLGESFDTMISGPSIWQLVQDGFLSMPVVYRPPCEVLEQYHVKRGDFDRGEQQKAMSTRKIVGDVIDHYRQHLDGLPTVAFCVSVDHAKLMAGQFREAGYRAAAVWGNMPRAERDEVIGGLRDGTMQVVCSCDVISEGVDVPAMAGAILLRRTMSLAVYLQQAGRALRIDPGKRRAVILDHVGNYYLHGHVLADRTWSLESGRRDPRKEEPPTTTTCPKCYGVWPGRPRSCPACGFSFTEAQQEERRVEFETIRGQLIEAGAPETEADQMAAFVRRTQEMEPAQRQKAMWGKAFEYAQEGESGKRKLDQLREMAGYRRGWTDRVWEYVQQKKRRSA